MFKNVAASFMVFAFDYTTGAAKTGDAANITAYVSKDYGAVTVLGDTTAAEMDATNAPGYYLFTAAQAETNADVLMVSAKSATANVSVIGAPAVIYTRPTTGWLAPTVAARTLDVSAGGEAGIDWANIGSPTTAQNLSATNIDVDQVVASVSGAVGSVTGAVGSVTGLTASNLDATISSRMASYTQPTGFLAATFPAGTIANTTNITAGTITTTTSLTNLPSIPADWITAAGIAAAALDGKGNWNIGKTGYSLTQAFPTNFSAIVITAGGTVSADVKAVNGTTVAGSGTAGSPWGA